jgi:hypothetical protein
VTLEKDCNPAFDLLFLRERPLFGQGQPLNEKRRSLVGIVSFFAEEAQLLQRSSVELSPVVQIVQIYGITEGGSVVLEAGG